MRAVHLAMIMTVALDTSAAFAQPAASLSDWRRVQALADGTPVVVMTRTQQRHAASAAVFGGAGAALGAWVGATHPKLEVVYRVTG